MKYLIVEPKVKPIAPNIALMKWARWCEQNEHQYQYVRGMVEPEITPDARKEGDLHSFNILNRFDLFGTEQDFQIQIPADVIFLPGG